MHGPRQRSRRRLRNGHEGPTQGTRQARHFLQCYDFQRLIMSFESARKTINKSNPSPEKMPKPWRRSIGPWPYLVLNTRIDQRNPRSKGCGTRIMEYRVLRIPISPLEIRFYQQHNAAIFITVNEPVSKVTTRIIAHSTNSQLTM
jgi:hypothetical protein